MNVIKADGTKERFDRAKIINTCLRAGADKGTAEMVANKIGKTISDNTTTHDIYHMILKELERLEDRSSLLFRLRESVALLDSESFELYIKKVLEASGFKCEWNKKVKGYFVEHQVDIIAHEQNKYGSVIYLVECKRHFNPHRFTGLGTCLQVQARFEDLLDGFKAKRNSTKFDSAWIATNGKFSDHAKMYAKGKNMRLTGWHYEERWELERLIQSKGIFPITILDNNQEVKELLAKKIITINDFLKSKYSRRKNMLELANRARKLIV
jgi:hypothetical protein